MRPARPIVLTKEEKRQLQAWTHQRGNVTRDQADRARMILMASEGATNLAIGERYERSKQCVCKWRRRYFEQRLDGLR